MIYNYTIIHKLYYIVKGIKDSKTKKNSSTKSSKPSSSKPTSSSLKARPKAKTRLNLDAIEVNKYSYNTRDTLDSTI